MAYRIEGNDIVIDGFNEGISDDPYTGINDITAMNVVSVPGEASVSFDQQTVNSSLVGTIASISSNTITLNNGFTGTVTNFTAVQFTTTGALPTGIKANTTYWLIKQSANSFQIYGDGSSSGTPNDCYCSGAVVTCSGGTGTNTVTSIDLGEVSYFERTFGYCIDKNGRVWSPIGDASSGSTIIRYTFMNNTTTNGNGNGICIFKGSGSNKYLMVFRNDKIDYTVCADTLGIFSSTGTTESGVTPSWTNGWKTLNTASGTNNPHEAFVGSTNKVFWTDANYIGTLREVPGATFDPATSSTYEFNATALAIPATDIAQCIDQLGNNLLIGGLYNIVYSWDRVSSGFEILQIIEKGIKRILTVNTNAFIFAGKRGRIFITNGSQAELFKKVPDHLLGIDPVFTFYGVAYNKNQVYFGISATTNSGTTSNNYAGLWAIDIDTKALRRPQLQATSTGTVVSVFSLPSSAVGFSLITAWKSGSTYGIDTALTTGAPYSSYTAYIVTDIIPVGLYLNKKTFENVEFKLSAPLVNGEGVKIQYRTNLTDSFTDITSGETLYSSTQTTLSDVYLCSFEQAQWVQLKLLAKSTATSPSYVRLKEIRLR